MTSVNETFDLMSEMVAMLHQDDDVTSMDEITDVYTQLNKRKAKREQQIKSDIMALTKMNDDVTCSDDTAKISHQEALLHEERVQVAQHRDQISKECKALREAVHSQTQELQDIKSEKERLKADASLSISKLRYDVNLYHNISRIRWQYDCEPDEVKGYVCNKTDVKPFSLNSHQNSHFFIVNHLWDLIEEDW